MLDRRIPPRASLLDHRPLPPYRRELLSNGLSVYLMPYGAVEMAEVQVVFRAGKAFQEKVGQASYTARMLSEGTRSYSSQKLAEKLDEHGSWIHHDSGSEFVSLNLTSLVEDLPDTLPLLWEVVAEPSFPEKEFANMKHRNLQRLQVQQEKTSTLARRAFGHQLYGSAHPYGMHLGPEELALLELDDLRNYHQRFLQPGNAFLCVAGGFEPAKMLRQLEGMFGGMTLAPAPDRNSAATRKPLGARGRVFVHREGPQSTIRAGHLGVDRNHPDYYGLEVLTTALGGYFGSRLMKNIREAKGYTYGIYGAWAANRHAGHFVVQTDVANHFVEATLEEIRKEMKRLQQEPVSADELTLLKNYMLGKGLRSRETPFQMVEILRYSLVYDIPFEELDRGFDVIQQIEAAEIQRLAREHFSPDAMLEVVVGGEAD